MAAMRDVARRAALAQLAAGLFLMACVCEGAGVSSRLLQETAAPPGESIGQEAAFPPPPDLENFPDEGPISVDPVDVPKAKKIDQKLWRASRGGDLKEVRKALKGGADTEVVLGDYADTPLTIAAYNGHLDVVEALLTGNADVNAMDNGGGTALYSASQKGHSDVVSALLKAGADVDVPDVLGSTPLHAASLFGNLDVVAALVEAGADVGRTGDAGVTPLYVASWNGYRDVVLGLVAGGANVDEAIDFGMTPLAVSAQSGHLGVVEALLEAGADPNLGNEFGVVSLHWASVTLGASSKRIAKALIAAGADVEARDARRATPLMWAARFGNAGTLQVLLDEGASPKAHDNNKDVAEDMICSCERDARWEDPIQCPEGGCDQPGTAKTLKNMLA